MSNHQPTGCVRRPSRSRGVRRVGLCAVAVLAAGVLLVAPSAHSHGIPSARADDCPDVEVTFARGTDEPAGVGRAGQGLVDALREQTGLTVGVYAVNYKATLFQLHTDEGSKDAVAHIKSMADKCPQTPQVLGGYSQGASVVDIVAGNSVGGLLRGTTLPAQYADNVAAVVTFGNIAGRTNQPISTQSALLGSKALDLCNPGDPICHAGPGNEWDDHTQGYVPVYTDRAASFVAAKLYGIESPTTYGPSSSAYGPSSTAYGPSPAVGPSPTTHGPSPTLTPPTAAELPVAFN